jgi:hypothetical protein
MGMDRAAFVQGDLPQVRTVAEMVRIREEAWLSIVAAPDDVLQGNSTLTRVLALIVIGKRRSFFYSERQ